MSRLPSIGGPLQAWRYQPAAADTRLWCELLDDPNPIHFDVAAVRRLGLGDRPVNQGPAAAAYFYNMLAANFPDGDVVDLVLRLAGNLFVGDLAEVTGTVSALEGDPQGMALRCQLELRVPPAGTLLASATALLHLPRGGSAGLEP